MYTTTNQTKGLTRVTKDNPCIHCSKTDWCYRLEPSGITVCERDCIATGWIKSGGKDKEDKPYLIPESRKDKEAVVVSTKEWSYCSRDGKPLVKVFRNDLSNGKKDIFQKSYNGKRWVMGRKGIERADIPIYRYPEIQKAISNGETIFVVEGEKCADALWDLGIPATTNIGGSSGWSDSDAQDLEGAKLVLVPDRDKPGIKLMAQVYKTFPNAQWLYVETSQPFWWNPDTISPSDGYDIADWIKDKKLTAEQVWDAVGECKVQFLPNPEIPDYAPAPEMHFTQKAINDLYPEGRYIAVNGNLYKFKKTHYQVTHPDVERKRIAEWAKSTPVQKKDGTWKTIYTTPEHVTKIWNWALTDLAVNPALLNPSGLNLKNGTLKLEWDGKKVSWKLHPHSPNDYYTYCSEINYDPKADQSNCNRLLKCLDPEQQTIFLRTIAASLDLNKIRQFKGRKVKALLLQGNGNNGKDALREAVNVLFGQTMTNITIGDLQAYDQGRKFPLAKLAGKNISWASENSKFASLDHLQCIKAAITGETIDIEIKNQPEYSINPATIFLFNCNDYPSVKSGLEAIKSRWAILHFTKTYKENADIRKGEIEADSRFKYDSEYLKEKVVPAFLNRILGQLQPLLNDGIDYSCTEQSLIQLQEDSNHIWQFCREVGLSEDPNGKVYIKDLWERLRHWYTQNGTLEVETSQSGKTKDIWHDQPHAGDKTVKGANQVFKRFTEIFPNIKRARETIDQSQVGNFYLSGVSFFASCASCDAIPMDTASLTPSFNEATHEATALNPQGYEAHEAVLPLSVNKEKNNNSVNSINLYSEINNPEMQHNFTEPLNNLEVEEEKIESSTPTSVKPLEVGDIITEPENPSKPCIVCDISSDQVCLVTQEDYRINFTLAPKRWVDKNKFCKNEAI